MIIFKIMSTPNDLYNMKSSLANTGSIYRKLVNPKKDGEYTIISRKYANSIVDKCEKDIWLVNSNDGIAAGYAARTLAVCEDGVNRKNFESFNYKGKTCDFIPKIDDEKYYFWLNFLKDGTIEELLSIGVTMLTYIYKTIMIEMARRREEIKSEIFKDSDDFETWIERSETTHKMFYIDSEHVTAQTYFDVMSESEFKEMNEIRDRANKDQWLNDIFPVDEEMRIYTYLLRDDIEKYKEKTP